MPSKTVVLWLLKLAGRPASSIDGATVQLKSTRTIMAPWEVVLARLLDESKNKVQVTESATVF
jgi:hypothetical protein